MPFLAFRRENARFFTHPGHTLVQRWLNSVRLFSPINRIKCVRSVTEIVVQLTPFGLHRQMQKVLLSFVDEVYEELELWYPKLRLEEAGYSMLLAANELKT